MIGLVRTMVKRIRNQPPLSWVTWMSLIPGLLLLGLPALDPSVLYLFRTSGTDGLSFFTIGGSVLIIFASGFMAFHGWVISREHFIYSNAIKSAAFHTFWGVVIGSLIAAPYGLLGVRNLVLSLFIFLAITTLSFSTWTYWRFYDLMRASRRLIWGRHADYRDILGSEASFGKLDERLSICRECLSLVGNDDETCWRCGSNFGVQVERMVASVNPSERLRPW